MRTHRLYRLAPAIYLLLFGALAILAWTRAKAIDERAATPPRLQPYYRPAPSYLGVIPAGTELGNPFEGYGCANWSGGRANENRYALSFIATKGGELAQVWLPWKTAPGYGDGTFGCWTVELRADGPQHLPADTVLAQGPTALVPREGFVSVELQPRVRLQPGMAYHLVAWNTDPAPQRNWSSPNTIMSVPDTPWRGDGVACSMAGAPWTPWGSRDNLAAPGRGGRAAYLLVYADGAREGTPYYSARQRMLAEEAREGELFTWDGPEVSIAALGVPVSLTASATGAGTVEPDWTARRPAGPLWYHLEEVGGEVLAAGILAQPDDLPALVTVARRARPDGTSEYQAAAPPLWRRVIPAAPVVLRTGHRYRLYLSAPTCAPKACYAIFVPYSSETVPGWPDLTWGGTAAGSVSYEQGQWRPAPVPADMTFSLIAGPA